MTDQGTLPALSADGGIMGSWDRLKMLLAEQQAKMNSNTITTAPTHHAFAFPALSTLNDSSTLVETELQRDLLRNENRALKSQLDNLLERMKAIEQTNTEKDKALSALSQELSERKEAFEALKSSYEQKLECVSGRAKVAQLENLTKSLQHLHDHHTNDTHYILKEEYHHMESKLQEVREENVNLQIQIVTLQNSNSQKSNEIYAINGKYSELFMENEWLKQSQSICSKNMQTIQHTNDQLTLQSENDRNRISALIVELRNAEHNLNKMEKTLYQQGNTTKELQKRIDHLETLLQEATALPPTTSTETSPTTTIPDSTQITLPCEVSQVVKPNVSTAPAKRVHFADIELPSDSAPSQKRLRLSNDLSAPKDSLLLTALKQLQPTATKANPSKKKFNRTTPLLINTSNDENEEPNIITTSKKSCGLCGEPGRDLMLKCQLCAQGFHYNCAKDKLNSDQFTQLVSKKRCMPCLKN